MDFETADREILISALESLGWACTRSGWGTEGLIIGRKDDMRINIRGGAVSLADPGDKQRGRLNGGIERLRKEFAQLEDAYVLKAKEAG